MLQVVALYKKQKKDRKDFCPTYHITIIFYIFVIQQLRCSMNETHFHRRNLPHLYRANSTYFITYRLYGSIPKSKIAELRYKHYFYKPATSKTERYNQDKQFLKEYDELLHNNKRINYLSNTRVAEIVKASLHFYDTKEIKLICYTIMPNHVHVLFHSLEISRTINRIMHSIKGYSALEANKILQREGHFWQAESYDHLVRDEDELYKIIGYILMNPVKAKLIEDWRDWKYSYLCEEL